MAQSWVIISGLIPSLFLVSLGYLLRSWPTKDIWSGLERLIYYFFFPALLFTSASARPIAWSDVFLLAPAAWGLMSLGLACGFLFRHWGPEDATDFAALWQTTYRFNTFLTLIAAAAIPGLGTGYMAITLGIAIPVANLFAVTAFARGQNTTNIFEVAKEVIKNPLLIASFSGFLVGVFAVPIPPLVTNSLTVLAQPALPLALLCIGAALNLKHAFKLSAFSLSFHAIKLFLLPAVATLLSLLFHFPPPIAATLIIFAAVPAATAALILASVFGANKTLIASQIAQSTVLSVITLPLWILVAASFMT